MSNTRKAAAVYLIIGMIIIGGAAGSWQKVCHADPGLSFSRLVIGTLIWPVVVAYALAAGDSAEVCSK